jgi:2-methylcitrate dehydratase PrpD
VPQVQALFPRVSTTTTTEQMQASAFSPSETVAIRTLGGDVFTSDPVVHAKGSHERPLSRQELWVKFSDCLGDGVPRGGAERAFERLQTLERLNHAGTLLQLQ